MQPFAGPFRRGAGAIALCAIAALVSTPATVLAWGGEGHRITGLVAAELLTPKARLRLNQLIPNADLADIALYMDINRQDLATSIPGSDKWHYDNEPVCKARGYAEYCPNGDCASSKIPQYINVLRDPAASADAKVQAIRFLVHMVGDIHQPLHAADDEDLGANLKFVLMPDAPANTMPPRRLHAVWDSDLVKLTTRGSSETDYAKQLLARYSGSQLSDWQAGSVRDWMKESWQLSRTVTYGNLPGFVCGSEWPSSPLAPQRLTQAYVDAAIETIPAQLAKAGARIAWVLNTALDPAPSSAMPAPVPDAAFLSLHKMFLGKWNGRLEYRDFRSDWRVTLPTTQEIAPRLSVDGAELVYQYVYGDGPANGPKAVPASQPHRQPLPFLLIQMPVSRTSHRNSSL